MSHTRFIGGNVLNCIKIALVASFLCVGTATLAAESQTVLQCSLPKQDSNSWVAQNIMIAYEEGSNRALVADPVIMTFLKKPVWAEMKDKPNRLTLSWYVQGGRDSGANPVSRMDYYLELKKSNNAVTVRARPLGYANILRGIGTCEPMKNRKEWERLLKKL